MIYKALYSKVRIEALMVVSCKAQQGHTMLVAMHAFVIIVYIICREMK